MSIRLKTTLVFFVTLVLTGCLQVKDFGEYWQQSEYDPCTADIVLKDLEPNNIEHADPKALWRVLDLGGYHFLLMKSKPKDAGGDLIRIDVENGEFIIFGLNQKMLGEFEKEYPDNGIIFDKSGMGITASIPLLDKQKAMLLQKVAAQERYWEQSSRKPYNPNNRNDCRYTQ